MTSINAFVSIVDGLPGFPSSAQIPIGTYPLTAVDEAFLSVVEAPDLPAGEATETVAVLVTPVKGGVQIDATFSEDSVLAASVSKSFFVALVPFVAFAFAKYLGANGRSATAVVTEKLVTA